MSCRRDLAQVAQRWSRTLQQDAQSQQSNRSSAELIHMRVTRSLLMDFWGSGQHLEHLMNALHKQGFRYSVCIDVGAGIYDTRRGSGDGSLALRFNQLFSNDGNPTRTFAFEPDPKNAVHELANRESKPGASITMSTELVSAQSGNLTLYGIKNTATSNLRLTAHPRYSRSLAKQMKATTIDELVRRHNLDHVDILKTDTEGCEWEVLQGAEEALRSHRVRVLLIAYEDKWSSDTFFAAYPYGGRGPAANVSAMSPPTLRSVTRQLEDFGYESYLLGSVPLKRPAPRVQMIPLSHGCWNDSFEIGRDPHAFGLQFTWFDFVSVLRGSRESDLLHEMAVAAYNVSLAGVHERGTSG